jgi:hypothetical protein
MTTLRQLVQAPDAILVLTRELPVRVLNVSASGCLMQSAAPLEEGALAALQVSIGGETCADDVRVTRCQRVEGAGSTYHIGVEFVWTTQPGPMSLRRLLRVLPARSNGNAVALLGPVAGASV